MNLALLLIQIAVILAVCRVLHGITRRLGQPPVIGEIIAGLLLGPSFLGWIAPSWYGRLFPAASLSALHGLSQIGLVLFMFLVGLRLDLSELKTFRRVAGLSAVLSIIVPFSAGLALARPLHALSPSAPMLPFSLFVAVSMSITAFPVLARILTDHRLSATSLGHVAIACAAFDDAAAWTLLAWITAMTRRGDAESSILGPLGLLAAYVILMVGPVRILLRVTNRYWTLSKDLPLILVFVLLSSWVTETIGLHALFGAFMAGVIWPQSESVAKEMAGKLETVAMVILLPLFFSYTGIRADVGLVQGASLWLLLLAIVGIAIAAKAGGAFTGARIMGFGKRDSFALGVLLNTRGLVELVVLNVGLELGILSQTLFSMMVLMALTTTMMTSPLLRYILPEAPRVD